MASSVDIERCPSLMPGVAEDFLWILINGLLYSKDSKWLLFSYLRNEACPLWRAVSQVCFSNVNDRATVCSSPLKGKTPAFLITGQDALWKESAFGAHSKRSQYCISAGGLRGTIPFNVVYASFKWLWAPGTGTWCPVYAEVSWWVCTAPFPRKIEGFFFPPK